MAIKSISIKNKKKLALHRGTAAIIKANKCKKKTILRLLCAKHYINPEIIYIWQSLVFTV